MNDQKMMWRKAAVDAGRQGATLSLSSRIGRAFERAGAATNVDFAFGAQISTLR